MRTNQIPTKSTRIQTQTLYNINLGETLEEWCETKAEQSSFDSTSVLLANPPISEERLIREDITIPTRKEFAKEETDTALKRLIDGIEYDQCSLANGLAGFDGKRTDRA